jgi:NAD+ kinase
MKKYHLTFDSTLKAKSLAKLFLKSYKNYTPRLADFIIVLGGDGFMLSSLKRYRKFSKPFYGINTGTYGFLMNKFKSFNLDRITYLSNLISISPLEMKAVTKNNRVFSAIAINEVSLLRQNRQAASLQIHIGRRKLLKKLVCDGVLISTPAGSTAYNLSVNGPILSLNSKKLAITSISPFRPRRWKGKVVPSSSIINIHNLNIKKRTVSVVADNLEVKNIKSVQIKSSKTIKFKLLYDKNNSLTKKIKLEQIRKIKN